MRNDWINKRLDDLSAKGRKKTQRGLAAAIGVAPPRVSEIVAGDRSVDVSEIPRMAAYLELEQIQVLELLNNRPMPEAPLASISVIGSVEAGIWAEALEWPEDEWFPAPVAADRRYPGVRQFGLEVRGLSMNEIFPPGSIVVCVKLMDIGRDPRAGEHVVVQRRSEQGFEATIKELRRDDGGGYWLWPRSRDPNFQQPWKIESPNPFDGADDVRIVALVIGSYRPQ